MIRTLTLLLFAVPAFSQGVQHAHWTLTPDPASAPPGSTIHIRADVQIDPGWHLYSASSCAGRPASFTPTPATDIRVFQKAPRKTFDSVLNAEAETYERETSFLLELKLPSDATQL